MLSAKTYVDIAYIHAYVNGHEVSAVYIKWRFTMKTLSAIILAAALSAAPLASAAQAETISLSAPLAGATLHSNDIAMSAYFVEADAGAFKVVVTYVGDAPSDRPQRIVMALSDGDKVQFGLPGRPGTLYAFSRNGGVVTISDQVGFQAGAAL
jgi:ABC-type glycerol-3-phosphate transport system substrate-binding protein